MLEHGGQLIQAAQYYGIPRDAWLDLSTGINPYPYPPPLLPLSAWQRLPEEEDGLAAVAASYYGNAELLAVAGSQAAIQSIPHLFPATAVACVTPIYNEHPAAWQTAGHTVNLCASLTAALECGKIVVLCNPNNPDGRLFDRTTLISAAQNLATKQGWLIVDEAFVDPDLTHSLTKDAGTACANLIVLRSLGKFFGLAGARVGFLFAAAPIRQQLSAALGPWTVSHPARLVANAALSNAAWQNSTRGKLIEASTRLAGLLSFMGTSTGTALFQYLPTSQAQSLHMHLAKRGILTRLFIDPPALRFGLPDTESDWQRLHIALQEWKL